MSRDCCRSSEPTGTGLNNWCALPTPMGEFRMYDSGDEGVRVVCYGDIGDLGPMPLLRVHSSCMASEVFGAMDCDCADQLREAMKLMVADSGGLIIHLHQEGRGQGLSKKISAVRRMQQDGLDTFEAFEAMALEQDTRRYHCVVQLLHNLGISSVRLISNNPRKAEFLKQSGVAVSAVRTHPVVRLENADYLATKNEKLGHSIPLHTNSQPDATIHFYHSDQPWGELSNFSRHAVFLRERIWPTVEHFYQAQKCIDAEYQESIRCCQTPMLAKAVAARVAMDDYQANWCKVKENVMLEGLRAKFQQHPDLRSRLLNTGKSTLIEYTQNDNYWGSGHGDGKNRLGHLLMKVRAELQRRADHFHSKI